MYLNIIASLDNTRCIGFNNELVYDIHEDKKYFSNVTKGMEYVKGLLNIVVMGKNTWNSLPKNYRPLKDRINIIISNELYNSIDEENTFVYRNFEDFYKNVITAGNQTCFKDNKNNEKHIVNEIFIIGGSKLYNHVIKEYQINKLYLTEIVDKTKDKKTLDSKVYFPEIKIDDYKNCLAYLYNFIIFYRIG